MWRLCSAYVVSAETLLLFVLVIVFQFHLTNSYLNLYISKEDLKNDLFLDFGNDLYVLSNGIPAPLLSNPNAFKNFIAPLTPFIEKIKFQWNIAPPGYHRAAMKRKFQYSFRLSSSDTEVMAEPKANIPNDAILHTETIMPEFSIEFPCTWKKYGIVDLGFQFNYTMLNGSDISHQVVIVVRRHCYDIPHIDRKIINTSLAVSRWNASFSIHKRVRKKTVLLNDNHNVIIGIAVGCCALFLSIMIVLILYCLRRRNRRLHLKFDIDYELKMRQREEEDLLSNYKAGNDISLKTKEDSGLFCDGFGKLSKPIYIPTTKKHRKRKKYRYRRHSSSKCLSISCHSDTNLENITEEDDELIENCAYRNEKGSPVILNLNLVGDQENYFSNGNLEGKNDNQAKLENKLVLSNSFANNENDRHTAVGKFSIAESDSENLDNTMEKSEKHVAFISSDLLQVANYATNRVNSQKTFKDLNMVFSSQFGKYLLTADQVVVNERFISKDDFCQVHRGKIRGLSKSEPNKVTPATVKIMVASPDTYYKKYFLSEAIMMKNCCHDNVMNLLGIVLHPAAAPLILTPHMRHSDLNQLLRNSRPTPRHHQALSTRQLINFGVQISEGMKYLAGKGYVHQNLSCKTCMVDSAFTIKISGLGFAREVKKLKGSSENSIYQSPRWMAIESLTDQTFSEKSDVWSFGVVLWELTTFGKEPYIGLKDEEVKGYLLDYRRLSSPPNWPDVVCRIMFSCWDQVPKDRPTFNELHEKLSAYEDKYKKYVSEYVPPVTEVVS